MVSCIKCLKAKRQSTPDVSFQPTYIPTHPEITISIGLLRNFESDQSSLTVMDPFSHHMK